MIKRIEKGDLVSLVFINSISDAKVNITDYSSQEFTAQDISNQEKSASSEISECYRNLTDAFFEKEADILPSHCSLINHHISLKNDSKLVYDLIYHLSKLEFKVLEKYIKKYLKKRFIHSFTSSFDSSVLFVKKLDSSLRLCVDYRALNRMTVKNHYLISLISEIMNRIKSVTSRFLSSSIFWTSSTDSALPRAMKERQLSAFDMIILSIWLCSLIFAMLQQSFKHISMILFAIIWMIFA